MFKKILFASAFLYFIFNLNLYSQNSTDSASNSLYRGSWSMQFGVSNNFTIGSFGGLLFSCKYHITSKLAIRFGVRTEFYDAMDNFLGFQDTISTISKASNITYGINPVLLYYFRTIKVVNLFAGIGPFLDIGHHTNSYTDEGKHRDVDERTWDAGAGILIGVEWFPSKSISFFGEYNAAVTYSHNDSRINDTYLDNGWQYEQQEVSHQTSFSGNTARLGISLYF